MSSILPLAVGFALLGSLPSFAKVTFTASDITGPSTEILFCDLDGDHLKDAVLVDGASVAVIYQTKGFGFQRTVEQTSRLDQIPAPGILWPTRLGGPAESLLVMTSDGITELCFTNRTSPPLRNQVVNQQTIIPKSLDEPLTLCLRLSADTGTDRPLLLAPVARGLQVWQQSNGWQQVQFTAEAVATHLWPSVANPGYTRTFALNIGLEDVNKDRREDLMAMRPLADGRQAYALYLQQPDGRFTSEPVLSYTNRADWRTRLFWVDVNRDGKLDLIKTTVSDELSFLPGLRSGKTVVGIYQAGSDGRLPEEPQQVFRKHDWSPNLPIVDVDGDGFVDLALGYMMLETREGMRRIITTEHADFSLRFHFYRPGVGFPKEPDCQTDAPIYFGREFFSSFDRRLDLEQFVNLKADLNGDGKKDLLIRDRRDSLRAFFFVSREKGFHRAADLQFDCAGPIDSWEVRDLNGDGISDVVVKLREQDRVQVFLSQKH